MEEELIKLTAEEAKFIEKLVLDNDLLLRNILRIHLGELFESYCDECLSDAHLLACKSVAHLKKHNNPDGWLVKVVKYRANDVLRQQYGRYHLPLSEELVGGLEDPCYNEVLFDTWMREGAIESALSQLTKAETEVFNLLYVELKDEDEAAKILGITKKSVNNLKNKVIHKINDYVYTQLSSMPVNQLSKGGDKRGAKQKA